LWLSRGRAALLTLAPHHREYLHVTPYGLAAAPNRRLAVPIYTWFRAEEGIPVDVDSKPSPRSPTTTIVLTPTNDAITNISQSEAAFVADDDATANPLTIINTLPANPFALTTPAHPLHYLGLCSGATFSVFEALACAGLTLQQITLVEQDPLVRVVASAELQWIHHLHPQHIPMTAINGTFSSLPQDVTAITSHHLQHTLPVDLVVATPDCQPFSIAGTRHGFNDPRAASLIGSM